MNNVIRICEQDDQPFNIVIINGRTTNNQGPLGFATTPADAYRAALRLLPAKQTGGATWEYRSKDGVYVDLDPVNLGW